jgi:hypothetical protein
MTDEVKRLCKEIKRLVPPKEAQSPSGPFVTFMAEFSEKITKQELESIHRAFNYFNRLVEIDLNTPVVAEPKSANPGAESVSKDDKSGAKDDTSGAKDDTSGAKDDKPETGAKENKPEVGASLPKPRSSPGGTESGNLAPKASTIDEKTTEEMIQILVELMEAKKD